MSKQEKEVWIMIGYLTAFLTLLTTIFVILEKLN